MLVTFNSVLHFSLCTIQQTRRLWWQHIRNLLALLSTFTNAALTNWWPAAVYWASSARHSRVGWWRRTRLLARVRPLQHDGNITDGWHGPTRRRWRKQPPKFSCRGGRRSAGWQMKGEVREREAPGAERGVVMNGDWRKSVQFLAWADYLSQWVGLFDRMLLSYDCMYVCMYMMSAVFVRYIYATCAVGIRDVSEWIRVIPRWICYIYQV